MANGNSVFDEIKEQHYKLKDEPLSVKLKYYSYYYKIHAILLILVVFLVCGIIYSIVSRKEQVLNVAFINSFPNIEEEVLMEEFNNYINLNTSTCETQLDATYYLNENDVSQYSVTIVQKLIANVSSGTLDVILSDKEYFQKYANHGYFTDLREILSEEELSKYGDHLIYAQIQDMDEDGNFIANDSEYFPVGIKVNDFKKVIDTQSYPNTTAYFGFVVSSSNTEYAKSFLDFLQE
ncbi:MAG: hypothetical protein ACRC7V_05110 [Lachnospiraceae bacterium]